MESFLLSTEHPLRFLLKVYSNKFITNNENYPVSYYKYANLNRI